MKRLSKILSIIILVMLTAFSIMQFHHHHCNGFAVSSVVEAIVEHEGCDDSDHHSSENDEHCGFHQDEAVEKRHEGMLARSLGIFGPFSCRLDQAFVGFCAGIRKEDAF